MPVRPVLLLVAIATTMCGATFAQSRSPGRSVPPPLLLTAKAAFFDDQTGAPKVGQKALEQLQKWGRFQIVQDQRQADVILLLSADPYKGGYIIYSGGQTGTIDKNGNIHEESIPYHNLAAPVRYGYLTVINPRTGENLWSQERKWGGLLTGFNSVGERLVAALKKETEK